jgi:hypothetical protein
VPQHFAGVMSHRELRLENGRTGGSREIHSAIHSPPTLLFSKLVNSKASMAQLSDGSLPGAACMSHVSATKAIELIREAIWA